jgi:glycerol-3-phosphate O-acyltransferase / dihydroxyacetone phosphate acyltransferase
MPFFERILEADEGPRRAAVKLLTHTIETRLVELTINAPDWSVNTSRLPDYLLVLFASIRDTLYVARMARDLLWKDESSLDRDEYVNISQT